LVVMALSVAVGGAGSFALDRVESVRQWIPLAKPAQ